MQVHFRNPKAFEEIYNFKFSTKFIKDAEFYDHLRQSEALFGISDEEEHKRRFKQVSDLFVTKKTEEFEPIMHNHVREIEVNISLGLNFKSDIFRLIVSVCCFSKSKGGKPVNIARGFRAVALDIAQDFVLGYVPKHLQGLNNENFDTLLVDTTFDVMDWTAWCFRNFPSTLWISSVLPQWLRQRIFPGEAANIASYTVRHLVNSNYFLLLVIMLRVV